MNIFQKASKKKSKLRCAIFGPSGSGKTYSALRIATGMGGKIALIDSESNSASKYADLFTFDVAELHNKDINNYIQYISYANEYDILIVDSLTHGWQELLEETDKLAQTKFRGNTWSAWSAGTPKQRKLVDALLSFPGHIIGTMRSKTEWTIETQNNKNKPVRVGLTPEQRKGIEYEFDILLEMNTENVASVIKDRTGKFQDKIFEKPDEEFGQQLAQWLDEGEEENVEQLATMVHTLCEIKKISDIKINEWLTKGNASSLAELKPDTLKAIVQKYS